jgi:hypothetical protein
MSKHEQARKYVDDIDGSGYFQRLHNYINEAEATEKELEEVKAMIKEIGDSCVSFDTSHQRVVFEALMNKVGRK